MRHSTPILEVKNTTKQREINAFNANIAVALDELEEILLTPPLALSPVGHPATRPARKLETIRAQDYNLQHPLSMRNEQKATNMMSGDEKFQAHAAGNTNSDASHNSILGNKHKQCAG